MNTNEQTQTMPSLFVSHGSPMLAVDKDKGQLYRQWARSIPTPKAILIFSAHWESKDLQFGETGTHNKLVYDFYGFPEHLYDLQYPAPGSEWLLEQVQNLSDDFKAARVTQRGLDHGVWVPLLQMWPDAGIPLLQMSLPTSLSEQGLYQLGQQLAPLRQQGILIITSGMVTHNLHEWNPGYQGEPLEWATSFDDWLKQTLLDKDKDKLVNWLDSAPNARRNHPTSEHFRPLLISAGATAMEDIQFPIEGFEYGMLSNRSIQFN